MMLLASHRPRTAHPTQARLKTLATHTVFGIGLYLASVAVSRLLT